MVFAVGVVMGPSVSDGNGLVLVSLVIRILIFSFLFFGFSLDFGHGISEKNRKRGTCCPGQSIRDESSFRSCFHGFCESCTC